MCDECTWHHKTFLVQSVYWHLAIKLYCIVIVLYCRFNELVTKSEKWNGKSRHPPSKTPVGVLPWTCWSEGKWPSRQTGGQRNHYKWLASKKIWCIEKLKTLPAGTKPRMSHHWSLGGERRGKRKREMIFFKRMREGHHQSDEEWNRFKGYSGETSERKGEVHIIYISIYIYMGFPKCTDTILN